jgi:farnesyl diphosphate synthase
MAGGQAIDLASVGHTQDEPALRHMHQLKTGALLHASVMLGAVCGQAPEPVMHALSDYAHAIGLAFQVVDDVLDVTSSSAALGKTAGKDADNDKPTYVSLLGLEASQRMANELLAQAEAALQASGLANTSALAGLANLVVQRSH